MAKENFEWARGWCDKTMGRDLPRVLLFGDSITEGYQAAVRRLLEGVCYVDFIASAYFSDREICRALLMAYLSDSKYDVVHLNNGLHGKMLETERYENGLNKLLDACDVDKIIIATSTIVYKNEEKVIDESWTPILKERNDVVYKIAKERKLPVDDLFTVSLGIPYENRKTDGYHYEAAGSETLAEAVVSSIKAIL